MAGLMLGTILGQRFVADEGPSALGFGRLLSAMSVLSADTINFEVVLRRCGRLREGTGQRYWESDHD
jgi:hypothetical protein